MKTGTAKLYNWALLKASSRKAPLWVALLFVLELFLFIPLDAVLIFFCLHNPKRTFFYAILAAIFSTLSSCAGYFLGHLLWDVLGGYIVPNFISHSMFSRIAFHLERYEGGAVFLGSLLPLPLKALSVAAGVFHLSFPIFVASILAGRLLRFGLIGFAMRMFGEKVKAFLERHFHRVFLLIFAKIAAVFIFFWASSL